MCNAAKLEHYSAEGRQFTYFCLYSDLIKSTRGIPLLTLRVVAALGGPLTSSFASC